MNEKEIEQLDQEADQLLMSMNQTQTESTSNPSTDPNNPTSANVDSNSDSQGDSGVSLESNAPGQPDSAAQSDKPKEEELSPLEKRLKDTQEFAHRKAMENSELARRLVELEQKVAEGAGKDDSAKDIKSLEDLKSEFPELVEPLMAQLNHLQSQISNLSGQVNTVTETASNLSHEQQIAKHHPNYQADVNTPEFAAWLQANPYFQQTAQAGNADDVVFMLNDFYASRTTPANTHQQMLEKARQDAEPEMRSQPTDPSQNAPKFTLADVEAMSMEEYEKNEAIIDQLMMTGQLR